MEKKIIANVFRYDPTRDDAPYYKEYEIPWQEDESGFMTGLQVLHYIYENIEPIAYDYNCRGGICGRCSMVIDGTPGLACYTPLQPGRHTFEPLEGLPIIRDLMIDRKPAMQKFVETGVAKKTIQPVEKSEDIDYDLYWNTLEKLNNCRECMMCYDVCGALKAGDHDYIGPGAMMQIAFRHLDPHDDADRVEQAVFSGLWKCVMCGSCELVCPAQIPHLKLLTMLRTEAAKRGMVPKDSQNYNFWKVEKTEGDGR
ncbi:MAG: 4Fe-4S dicluster domain-containing protein [Clostridiales bacterium]|nr:4Fe-4S dicluster domain-containing protein [Clostridiales bacterium]